MAVDRYLIDTSALVRMGRAAVHSIWAAAADSGLIHLCDVNRPGFRAHSLS